MTILEIVALVVAVLTSVTKFLGVTKEWWAKLPVLAHYVPGALVVLTLVGEKLAGVKDVNDLIVAVVALVLLGVGHFTKSVA